MKRLLILCLLASPSALLAANAETLFTLRNLKGEIQIYSAPDGSLLLHPEKHEDGQSDSVYLQREKEGEKENYFVAHNNGRSKVVVVVGEKSLTFVESYGDNNFLWTICFDKKDKDGSCLVVCVSVKASGILGNTSSSVMSGRAYR